jgi:endonuclease YncB( thermonuclease family)
MRQAHRDVPYLRAYCRIVASSICLVFMSVLTSHPLPATTSPVSSAAAQATNCPVGQYWAQYFNNVTLSGTPAFTRCEATVSYAWGSGGPGNGLGTDNFSVRWTGRHQFAAGSYTFTIQTDDGARLWLDGQVVHEAWKDQGAVTYVVTRTLTAGEHEVSLEYYENGGGAVARLNWQAGGGPTPTSTPTGRIEATVTQVANGDTLDAQVMGQRTLLRYLGAEAPLQTQPCGPEALERNRELAGARVLLEEDPAYPFDAAGARLLYAYTAGGQSIDAALIREGLARAVRIDARHGAELAALQAEAQASGRGCLWAASPTATATATATATPSPTAAVSGARSDNIGRSTSPTGR